MSTRTVKQPARREALAWTISSYDRMASEYADRFAAVDLAVERAAFLRTLPSTGLPILDAGCGAGRDAEALRSRYGRVVAVDLSRGLLVEAGDATSTPLAQSDVRALPFAAQSFAGVWCAAVLVHQTPDEALDTLREFHRSLAPHGALFVSAQTTAQHGWRVEGDHRRWFETYTLELLAGLLTDAGFVIQQTGENADQVRTGVAWVNALATKG